MLTDEQFSRFQLLLDRKTSVASRGSLTSFAEEKFADFFSVKTLLVNSGTAALHLCLKSVGVGVGDEVIVPNFTFSATALAVKHCGANPVFASVNLPSGWIDLESVRRLVTPKTKVIVPVHLNGHIGNIQALTEFASQHNIYVIEDACQAFGSFKDGVKPAVEGVASCYSFNSSKHLPAGEGGLIVSRDQDLLDSCWRMMRFGDTGLKSLSYDSQTVGWNFKAPEIIAALLLAQIPDIHTTRDERRNAWIAWSEWSKENGFTLPYSLAGESPWRICLIPDEESMFPESVTVNSGRWCQKPVSQQAFFLEEKYDSAGLSKLERFMKDLVWIDIGCEPPNTGKE